MLVETARMWDDLGFFYTTDDGEFHIHGVTGPDEYTTVVNDNLYTNLMARSTCATPRGACDPGGGVPDAYAAWPAARLGPEEIGAWRGRRRSVHAVRRGPSASTSRTTTSSSHEPWDFEAPRRTSTRCCCTTTRSSSTATR